MGKTKDTMTLMELIIVIVILGILSMAGVVGYRRTVLAARDREAQAMLRLIKHAADVRRLETNTYVGAGCGNTAACNAVLRLNLPTPPQPAWVYRVQNVTATSFCTQALWVPAEAGVTGFHIRRNVTTGVDESNLNPLPAGGC